MQKKELLEEPLTPKRVNFIQNFFTTLTLPSDVDRGIQKTYYCCVREVAILAFFTFATAIIMQ